MQFLQIYIGVREIRICPCPYKCDRAQDASFVDLVGAEGKGNLLDGTPFSPMELFC